MTNTTSKQIATGIVLLLLILSLGAFAIHWYIDQERQRDMQRWESRMGLVADTRVTTIEQWMQQQFTSLEQLASNASLQLYLWQLSQKDTNQTAKTPGAQRGYLRNLLLATAQRDNFTSSTIQTIPANIKQTQTTGLALYDAHLKLMTATGGLAEADTEDRALLQKVLTEDKPLTGVIRLTPDNESIISFAVPVHAVLGANSETIGVILGIRNADSDLFPLLHQGASFAEGNETLLLSLKDDQITYLSPTRDGTAATRRRLPRTRQNLAAATAFKDSQTLTINTNYRGDQVLAVSRPLTSTPWVIQQQVNARQAMQESNNHRNFLLTTLSLLLLSIAALAIAAWRHGSSVKAMQQNAELRHKTIKLQKQTTLLHAITDNIDTHTLLLSNNDKILFANQSFAHALKRPLQEIPGTHFNALFDTETRSLIKGSNEVITLNLGEHEKIYQNTHIPIKKLGKYTDTLLIVLHDITALQKTQRNHQKLLRNLISTLVHTVDLHDPYSAYHSIHMAEVANAIGQTLKLNDTDREALDLAATLANIGKIMIPREVLTKTDPLTQAEQELLQKHVQYGLELLDNLQFEGPVLKTIAQKQEHIDGSGYPHGLTESEMTLTGKILSVSNAFVALVSPRAYRDKLDINAALDKLMAMADSHYDRHVVAALFHIVENQEDWSQWDEPGA
ncbi:MAG: HD domain-containing phosphohydrolase [Gammaproteobacteria bacterium]